MLLTLFFACAPETPSVSESIVETAPLPIAQPEPVPPTPPSFTHSIRALSQHEMDRMTGITWTPGCPVPLDGLVRVEALHHVFDGGTSIGAIIVRAEAAQTVVDALRAAFDDGFPIERMEPVVNYEGSDQRSMNANNTSAFNCRPVTGGSSYSEHSYGNALDINPAQNPYISASGKTVLPATARAYLDREDRRPGMLHADSALVESFLAAGWGWGGNWARTRDYQHLSETGR